MVVIPPYPWHLNPDDFERQTQIKETWKVCPQLFFTCKIKPFQVQRATQAGSHSDNMSDSEYDDMPEAGGSDSEMLLELIFFSTFDRCNLTPQYPLQKAGFEMLYEPSPLPCLYVGHAHHALGRVPLMPCYLEGNATPTIPYSFRHYQRSCFPNGQTDSANGKRPGSKLYEVNEFMWTYGRPKKRGESVEEAEKNRMEKLKDIVETRKATRASNLERRNQT